jgi:hypothetical protein
MDHANEGIGKGEAIESFPTPKLFSTGKMFAVTCQCRRSRIAFDHQDGFLRPH